MHGSPAACGFDLARAWTLPGLQGQAPRSRSSMLLLQGLSHCPTVMSLSSWPFTAGAWGLAYELTGDPASTGGDRFKRSAKAVSAARCSSNFRESVRTGADRAGLETGAGVHPFQVGFYPVPGTSRQLASLALPQAASASYQCTASCSLVRRSRPDEAVTAERIVQVPVLGRLSLAIAGLLQTKCPPSTERTASQKLQPAVA